MAMFITERYKLFFIIVYFNFLLIAEESDGCRSSSLEPDKAAMDWKQKIGEAETSSRTQNKVNKCIIFLVCTIYKCKSSIASFSFMHIQLCWWQIMLALANYFNVQPAASVLLVLLDHYPCDNFINVC